MARKYVYIQLYPKDLMADEKLRKCDKVSAWGAYLALLNIMALEKIRGCVRLRDWDTHPNNQRLSLVAGFKKAKSLRDKASAFAKIVSQCTPLKGKRLVDGIEQLIEFDVVVMHDDALIQPRMFRESKSSLEGYDPEPEMTEAVILHATGDSIAATADTAPQKDHPVPAPALRANTRDLIIENEPEHNNNNSSSKGGVGDCGAAVVTEDGGDGKSSGATSDDGFMDFWHQYDKRYISGSRIPASTVRGAWTALSADERSAAMAFLPQYVEATPTKQYRMHPRKYLEERAWLTIKIEGGRVRSQESTETTKTSKNEALEAVADGGAVNVSPEDGKTAREPEKGKSGASAGRGAKGAMTSYPTLEEIQAYMDERAAQGKPFLYITAEGYLDACEQSGWTLKDGKPVRDWRARLRTFETYRKEHGDRPVSRQPAPPSPPPTPPPKPGDPVPATRQSKGKYKNKW